ncbi:hypothetical protein ACFL6G_00920 [candidate division KSB1 bacterium]
MIILSLVPVTANIFVLIIFIILSMIVSLNIQVRHAMKEKVPSYFVFRNILKPTVYVLIIVLLIFALSRAFG